MSVQDFATKNFYEYPVTSEYGHRVHPITGKEHTHSGIDYGLPLNTYVNSNVSGTVTKSTYNNSYGNYVVIDDGNGRLHYYAHLNERMLNVGDKVNQGTLIGKSGSTGNSTGPHLHYEVRNSSTNQHIQPFTSVTGEDTTVSDTYEDVNWEDSPIDGIKDGISSIIGTLFKYIIIVALLILAVIFFTNGMDIE